MSVNFFKHPKPSSLGFMNMREEVQQFSNAFPKITAFLPGAQSLPQFPQVHIFSQAVFLKRSSISVSL